MIHALHRMQKVRVVLYLYDACAALHKLAVPAGHPFNIASFHRNNKSGYCFKYEPTSHSELQMYKKDEATIKAAEIYDLSG